MESLGTDQGGGADSTSVDPVGVAYRRAAPRLLAFIRARVTSGEDAEDILHEVFAQAARPNVLAAVDDVVAWLFRAARNRVVDWYRRRGRRPETSLDAVADGVETSLGELLVDAGVDVTQEVARRLAVQAMARAIASLPSKQRQAFVGHVVEGGSFREMAASSGAPIGTLLARKHRAVARLRTSLQNLEEVLDE